MALPLLFYLSVRKGSVMKTIQSGLNLISRQFIILPIIFLMVGCNGKKNTDAQSREVRIQKAQEQKLAKEAAAKAAAEKAKAEEDAKKAKEAAEKAGKDNGGSGTD